jgi:hypothetical protein
MQRIAGFLGPKPSSTGDLATLQQMRSVADEVNALGIFDAIVARM